jgi:hypothetical protein
LGIFLTEGVDFQGTGNREQGIENRKNQTDPGDLGECYGLFSIVNLAAHENLLFAFVYNSIGIPLAAGVLFPTFGLLLNPVIAIARGCV